MGKGCFKCEICQIGILSKIAQRFFTKSLKNTERMQIPQTLDYQTDSQAVFFKKGQKNMSSKR
jgi:hypothetical protein